MILCHKMIFIGIPKLLRYSHIATSETALIPEVPCTKSWAFAQKPSLSRLEHMPRYVAQTAHSLTVRCPGHCTVLARIATMCLSTSYSELYKLTRYDVWKICLNNGQRQVNLNVQYHKIIFRLHIFFISLFYLASLFTKKRIRKIVHSVSFLF